MHSLVQKYNVPGPRYTSYPTVPFWDETFFSHEKWMHSCRYQFDKTNQTEGISLYIHLPYCSSLCTFCGCHKRITKNHEVELPYIEAVLKEWTMYVSHFSQTPIIKELHLGGGTPTFFKPENLSLLIQGIFKLAQAHSECEMSFEGHPNSTTIQHLEVLYNLGFRRVSYGIQDYDPIVQQKINRIQSFERVAELMKWSREIGYTSISHDIVYGLPFQTIESIQDTIEKTKKLQPDRIAFYSYAHVPWIKGNGQRGFKDEDVPIGEAKRMLYEKGKELLLQNDFVEIGMDHFAQKTDLLYKSFKEGKMHRNFMGYTHSKTTLMIGLGASSISDSWNTFAQNEKSVEDYLSKINEGVIPVFKGHILTEEDVIIRKLILDLMCSFQADMSVLENIPFLKNKWEKDVEEFEKDGLIEMVGNVLKINEKGKAFVRNICMTFDVKLRKAAPETQLFSMTI